MAIIPNPQIDYSKLQASFPHIFDAAIGAFRPLEAKDINNVINVAGGIKLEFDTKSIVNAIQDASKLSLAVNKVSSQNLVEQYEFTRKGGSLFSINGLNAKDEDAFVHVFDDKVRIAIVAVSAKDNFFVDFGANGITIDGKIKVVISDSISEIRPFGDFMFVTISYK